MKYRKFRDGALVSQVGLGCMRLPIVDGDTAHIDEKKAEEMMLYAVENGVNYFDSAYAYHGKMSEKFVGKVVKNNNLRDKVYLATKSPTWLVREHNTYYTLFEEQLDNLQTDYVDFYLMHSLGAASWRNALKSDPLPFLDAIKQEGRARRIGFSFHDNLPAFKQIVDAYDWDFCQIQLNYMDENYQAGMKGLAYAAQKGLPVVVMEPLKGGQLASILTPQMQQILDENSVSLSLAGLGLKYLFDKPEVGCVLSGASNLAQLKENIEMASSADVGELRENEKKVIEELKAFYNARTKVPCTGCLYCIDDCPQRIPINSIFSMYNNMYIYDNPESSRVQFAMNVPDKRRPSACQDCGICEEKCPQGIAVRRELKIAQERLEVKE